MDPLFKELDELESAGLRRRCITRNGCGGRINLGAGATLLNFSSNNYLDLAHHPYVKEQAVKAVEKWGCGCCASRLMCGTLEIHDQLEAALARLVGSETALVFPSGFGMNVGVIAALAGRDDVIFADRLNHASLVDGARLSGAAVRRFPHNDMPALARLLAKPGRADASAMPPRRRLVICESVYSMDGDRAPLRQLRQLGMEHDAMLLIDEAHALGVYGGGLAHDVPPRKSDLIIGTLGKALGSQGGFVGCTAAMRDILINRARSFIYSTSLAPACAAAALAAIECIERDPTLGQQLLDRARRFYGLLQQQGLSLAPFQSQIIPIHVGPNAKAMELARRLQARNLLAVAIRPPTVPAGTARIRLSVTLAHSTADLELAASTIGSAAREVLA